MLGAEKRPNPDIRCCHARGWWNAFRWALVLSLAATGAAAETITLQPAKDNTLFEDAEGARSNGKGVSLFAGRASGSDLGRTRRALLAFDVAGSVPAGATVVAARLTLNMTRTVSGAQPMTLHRVLADWGEGDSNALGEEGMGGPSATGDATWLHRFFGTDMVWTSEGGDFSETASATRSVAGVGSYTWASTPELIADVQGWLDAPQTNFGWILIGSEATQPTAKRFSSRESSASVRPRLEIEFEAAVGPTRTATEVGPSPTMTHTETTPPTPTETALATETATPTATATAAVATPTVPVDCAGDCDRDGVVSLHEVVRGANVALGRTLLDDCPSFDRNDDGRVTIDELVRAVRGALVGCGR